MPYNTTEIVAYNALTVLGEVHIMSVVGAIGYEVVTSGGIVIFKTSLGG